MLEEHWYEPPNTADLHLSTLTQQILSVIAQHGGATAAELFTTLCATGPFCPHRQGHCSSICSAASENPNYSPSPATGCSCTGRSATGS